MRTFILPFGEVDCPTRDPRPTTTAIADGAEETAEENSGGGSDGDANDRPGGQTMRGT